MHSFNSGKTTIHHNAFETEGEIIIYDNETKKEFRVEATAIFDFVLEALRIKKISQLEQMNREELIQEFLK